MSLFNKPDSWSTANLSTLIAFAIGGDWGKDEAFDDPNYADVLCIRGSEFKNWEQNKGSTASLRRIKKSSLENRLLHTGDILLEISGGGPEQPVGRTVLIDKTVLAFRGNVPKVCTNFLRLLRPVGGVDPSYLNFFLSYFYKSGEVVKYQGGSNNLRNLKFDDYMGIQIPIAPLREQKRIVAKIEDLFSELDKGIESLKTAREQLKAYRQAVLNAAVNGDLLVSRGLIKKPFGKELLRTLKEVVSDLGQGWSPKCHETPSPDLKTWGVIKTTAIQHLKFDDAENKELPANLEPRPHLEIKAGDLLITRAGPRNRVGVSCLVKKCRPKLILCDKAYRLRVNSDVVMPEYLEMLLNCPTIIFEIEELKTGINDSGVNLTQDRFTQLKVKIPSLDLQNKTLNELSGILSNIDRFLVQIDESLMSSDGLRQSILKKAFSGQLVARNPKDEPASTLLERIRAENEAPKSRTKKKRSAA